MQVGHAGDGFCFDNETPVHSEFLAPWQISSHLVRNGDWSAFIADQGYRTATLWMSDGWAQAASRGLVRAAALARNRRRMVADGPAWSDAARTPTRRLAPCELVRGRCLRALGGRRLPTEAEWEAASGQVRCRGNDRPCLAMDRKCISSVSRLSTCCRCGRRVQRQVHDQSDGTARRVARHAAGSYAAHLSEFLSPRQTLAVQRRAPRSRRLRRKAIHAQMTPPWFRRRAGMWRTRRSRVCCRSGRRCRRSCSTTKRAVVCSRRSPNCRNTI